MVQQALRQVVRNSLSLIAKQGFPGDHHFYVAFQTDFPGVDLPDYLKKQYPNEITIILQYEFWDLEVEENQFSVTLCFEDMHERITVPFSSIISFVDPSVKFGLQFNPSQEEANQMPQKTRTEPAVSDSNVITLDMFRKK
ncbi:MAG: hypothetical protein HYS39_03400 [Proteobacteria bacterium]|nr:hypothetical protein [Pseudomonadota bacterium]